jgi:hypothetical protein
VTPEATATASIAHVSKCTTRSRSSAPARAVIASPSSANEPQASGPKNPIVSFFEQ